VNADMTPRIVPIGYSGITCVARAILNVISVARAQKPLFFRSFSFFIFIITSFNKTNL
jgi:hypothetical protein